MANNETSIIISAVDKSESALKSAQGNVSALSNEFGRLTGVVTGFAALAGVTAFAGIVKGAVDSAAGLHDMAQQTGASVESLSAMRTAAKLAGSDMEQVAGGLGKLSKNMLEASQGSGNAANVFKALGISVTDSSGKLKTSDAVFLEFAKGLQTVGSSAERAAAAQLVLGKSGAQLMPLMNDMAVAGTLQAKITSQQAAAADDLQDNLLRLSTVGQAWKTTVVMEIVPAANAFVEALLDVSTTTDGSKKAAKELAADGSIKEWAISSAKAVGFVVDSFDGASRVIKGIGMTIGAAAAQAAMVAQGNFGGAMAVGKDWLGDMSALAGKEQFSDVLARKLATIGSEAPKAAAGTKSLAVALRDLADDGGKAAKALDNLHITQMALITKQAVDEMTALTKTQEDYVKALAAALDPLEKQAQSLEREVANYGLAESAIQGAIIARMEEARAMAALNGAWPEHLDYLDREIELRKRIAGASAQKEFLDTNKRAAEAAAREWEKVGDDINRALTDALMRGFESGKSFGQNFADSLKNSLKTLVIKLVVNMIGSSSGGLIASVADAALGTRFSSASSGASGTSNLLGGANNLSTAYSMYNNAGLLAQWAGGSMSTANALGTVYANATTSGSYTALDGLLATNGAYGTAGASGSAAGGTAGGSTAGAGVSTVAWVAAIVAGMWMSSQAWKAGIRWENYAKEPNSKYDAETWIRAAHDKPAEAIFGKDFVNSEFYAVMGGGSLSAQIHYAIQGALFGKTRVTGSQVQGAFSEAEQGFTGRQGVNFKKTGGLFSSSKEWTEWSALPATVDSAMDSIYRGVRNSFIMLGDVFEDTSLADKLQGFVYAFSAGSLSADSVAAGLTASMSNVLTPSINAAMKVGETWATTFQRVLLETNAVRRAMAMMGDDLIATFGKNNLDGILKASDAFVQLFGSVDAFNQSFGSYYANFFSQQDQAAQAWRDMKDAFTQIGSTMPTTRQGFRDLVDSLDLSTTAGRSTFKALMDVQGAFASLTPTIEDAAAAALAMQRASQEMQATQIGNYYTAQRKAQEAALKEQMTGASSAAAAATQLIDSFKQISSSLGSYRAGLLTSSDTAASPFARYDAAKLQYESTAASSRLGNIDSANQLQSVAAAFLAASREVGTSAGYARDVAGVIATIDSVTALADRQIPLAESQLTVAQDQLTALQAILDQMTGNQSPALVANYQQAATDWAQFFSSTTVGATVQTAAGTMQRISDAMGLLIDSSGKGYTFSQSDNPYTLANSSDAYRQYLLQKYGQWTGPSFAAGGLHGGGLRLVGENGPELEITGPSRILNTADTSALLNGGGGMAQVVAALTREIAELRAEQRAGHAAIVANTGKTARTLDKFDIDGLPEVRAA